MEKDDFKLDSSPSGVSVSGPSGSAGCAKSTPSNTGSMPSSLSLAGYGSIIHDIQSFPSHSMSVNAIVGRQSSSRVSEMEDERSSSLSDE